MSYGTDSLRTLVIRIGLIFVNLVSGIVLARSLGPEGVGIFALLLLVPTFCFRFVNLGVGSSLSFFTARKEASMRSISNIAWILCAIMSLASISVISIIWRNRYLPWYDISPRLFYVVLVTIPLVFLLEFFQKILSGQLRIKALNFSEVIRNISYIVALIVLLFVFKLNIIGAIYAYILSELIAFLFVLMQIQTSQNARESVIGESNAKHLMRKFLSYGKWNYFIMLNNFFITQFPLVALKYFCSNEIVGLFSVGKRIIDRVDLLPTTFANLLFPYTAGSGEEEAIHRTNTLCRNFILIMGIIGSLLAATAEPLIVLLYGEDFRHAAKILYALLPSFLFFPVTQFTVVHIAASGKSKLASLSTFMALPVGLLTAIILIPMLGPIGAAFSFTATFALRGIISIGIYASNTNSSPSEIIIPNKTDWILYKKLFYRYVYPRNTPGNSFLASLRSR